MPDVTLTDEQIKSIADNVAHADELGIGVVSVTTAGRLIAALRESRDALRGLVTRLDEVHADERYKGVWTFYAIHGHLYSEPPYTDALAAARAALGETS